jgi:hypothetical protein
MTERAGSKIIGTAGFPGSCEAVRRFIDDLSPRCERPVEFEWDEPLAGAGR